MDCKTVRDSLAAYLDLDLEKDKAMSVQNHLRECERCDYAYKRMVNAWKALDFWEETDSPPDLKATILNRIKNERSRRLLKVLLPAAALLIISIGIFLFVKGFEGKEARQMLARTQDPPVIEKGDLKFVNEEEIILNLHLLQEKEFYDSLEVLKKIDYLPLVDDMQEKKGDNRSGALEFLNS